MKLSIVCLLLLSVRGQMYAGEWIPNLFANINRMNRNIEQNIMNMNQQMQQDVQQRVNQVQNNVQRIVTNGLNTGTAGGQGMVTKMHTGGSIALNSGLGNSQFVVTGYGPDRQPYQRESQDRIVGTTLYHTDKIYYPSLGTTNEFQYTLDLTDPTARPVLHVNQTPRTDG